MCRFFLFLITVYIFLIALFSSSFNKQCIAETTKSTHNEYIEKADKILVNRHCPCQCARYLPGSAKKPACFGCSVGKAEISFVLEALESGREISEIILDLNSPIIIDVFADYTNKSVAKVWKLVKTVSREMNQNRVVLRAPGLTPDARRAIQIAEYARLKGNFSLVQDALIKHKGPWDWNSLIALIPGQQPDPVQIQEYVPVINIIAQIAKDQQHAKQRNINMFPTITINNQLTLSTENHIKQVIKNILLQHSI